MVVVTPLNLLFWASCRSLYNTILYGIPNNTIQIMHTIQYHKNHAYYTYHTTHYTFIQYNIQYTIQISIQIMPVTELPLPTNAYPRCLIVIVIVIIIIPMVIIELNDYQSWRTILSRTKTSLRRSLFTTIVQFLSLFFP